MADTGHIRAGILGGTFDPVHLGHLILAEEARLRLGLDLVYFVPAGDPPHKHGQISAGVEDRLRMAQLAVAGNPCFAVSRVDADRPGPHYTLDMVRILQRQMPATELYFLVGFDSLQDLPTWHRPAELVAATRLVALTRYAVTLDWPALESAIPGIRKRVTLLDMPEVEIASRDLRARVACGESIRYLVPDEVRHYIEARGLYAGGAGE